MKIISIEKEQLTMNKKAEIFQKYLEEKEIKAFQMEEIKDDELKTVVFRSNIEAEGQQLPTMIITDETIYTMFRVQVAAKALREDNEVELIKVINEINAKYKILKYYFAENGDLVLDSCVVSPVDELDGDMVYTILDVIVKHLTSEYRQIMKKIWG